MKPGRYSTPPFCVFTSGVTSIPLSRPLIFTGPRQFLPAVFGYIGPIWRSNVSHHASTGLFEHDKFHRFSICGCGDNKSHTEKRACTNGIASPGKPDSLK